MAREIAVAARRAASSGSARSRRRSGCAPGTSPAAASSARAWSRSVSRSRTCQDLSPAFIASSPTAEPSRPGRGRRPADFIQVIQPSCGPSPASPSQFDRRHLVALQNKLHLELEFAAGKEAGERAERRASRSPRAENPGTGPGSAGPCGCAPGTAGPRSRLRPRRPPRVARDSRSASPRSALIGGLQRIPGAHKLLDLAPAPRSNRPASAAAPRPSACCRESRPQ